MEKDTTIITSKRLGKCPIASFEITDKKAAHIIGKHLFIETVESKGNKTLTSAIELWEQAMPKEGVKYIVGIDAASDGGSAVICRTINQETDNKKTADLLAFYYNKPKEEKDDNDSDMLTAFIGASKAIEGLTNKK